jgi:ADP-ribosyl-[dinitrogen reductase] hydrolase
VRADDRMSFLPIATIALAGGGAIGVAPCPSATDRDAIAAWRPDAVVTLIEPGPRADAVGALCAGIGVAWHHLPITDLGTPEAAFETGWRNVGPDLRAALQRGGRVLVHCAAGRGRSGTIAARLLVELGEADAATAIARVRQARPGAVETAAQEAHVAAIAAR